MPQSPQDSRLADRRYVFVVIRLQLDSDGRLIQGELVDGAGEKHQRFVGWRDLTKLMREWFSYQQRVDDTKSK